MFDTVGMGVSPVRNLAVSSFEAPGRTESAHRRAQLQLIADRVAPTALAREQTLPVLPALCDLFPDRALRRGTVIDVAGQGATTLALAVAAGPSTAGSWVAVVGHRDLGLRAASELGVCLERLLVVRVDSSGWAATVAALVGAVDVVLVGSDPLVSHHDARRLGSRLRERGSVLLHVTAPRQSAQWPGGADVRLQVKADRWVGLGLGYGLLTARPVTVCSGGRGAAARPRSVELLLPGPNGAVNPSEP